MKLFQEHKAFQIEDLLVIPTNDSVRQVRNMILTHPIRQVGKPGLKLASATKGAQQGRPRLNSKQGLPV